MCQFFRVIDETNGASWPLPELKDRSKSGKGAEEKVAGGDEASGEKKGGGKKKKGKGGGGDDGDDGRKKERGSEEGEEKEGGGSNDAAGSKLCLEKQSSFPEGRLAYKRVDLAEEWSETVEAAAAPLFNRSVRWLRTVLAAVRLCSH